MPAAVDSISCLGNQSRDSYNVGLVHFAVVSIEIAGDIDLTHIATDGRMDKAINLLQEAGLSCMIPILAVVLLLSSRTIYT